MIATAASLFVALLHFGFMVLETFMWTTTRVRRIFGQTVEGAATTKLLAANQGVYNGALALCLAVSAVMDERFAIRLLLGFVIVVGIYGAVSVKRSILFIQALPAALALLATYEH